MSEVEINELKAEYEKAINIDDGPKRWYLAVPFTGKRLIFEGFFHYVGWYRPKLDEVV